MPPDQNPETQEEFDTAAAVADISSDLFGQGGEEGETAVEKSPEGKPEEVSGQPSPVETAPASQETTPEVQATGAPTTWSKEALAEWATIPARAQQEILKREEDMHRGLSQYKERADLGSRFDAVSEPYRAILQAESIDPVQLYQSFAANHYLLSRGTPEQKLQLAANLVEGYNIDFGQLIDYMGNRSIGAPDPQVRALEARLAQMEAAQTQSREQALNVQRAQIESEVSAFAVDHPYFEELSDDIAKLLTSGVAPDLSAAYEAAVYANPVTRQKELDRLTAEARASGQTVEQARADKIARSTAADVKTIPTPRNGTVPRGSMDDTLADVLSSIQSRA